MAVQFFYDQQIRRFLLQFTRLVSNFQVQFGSKDPVTNKLALQTVPVYYGDGSRQASIILGNNSENTLQTVPAMAFYISAFQYDRARIQDPTFIGKLNIRERKYDPITGIPTREQGDTYTVERLMPVPYLITIKLDIWTSNTEQKFQLLEQLTTLFNPSLEIQSTDNYIDWTSLSVITLTDVNWSSRTVPIGTEDPIDICTMTFELPVFISPPAKVTQMGVIQRVIASVFDSTGQIDKEVFDYDKVLVRRTFTVLGYSVALVGNRLKLVRYNEFENNNDDIDHINVVDSGKDVWRNLISEYGALVNGTSQVRLEQANGTDVIGTVAFDPTDETQLLFNVLQDTIPVNTLPPIDGVIDPHKINVGSLLLNNDGTYKVATGTRYLIIGDINSIDNTDFALAWNPNGHPLIAHANDIIEYNGTNWVVKFDGRHATDKDQFLINHVTGMQLHWDKLGWVRSYEGVYREEAWRLVL
jgi:hypothetical protein